MDWESLPARRDASTIEATSHTAGQKADVVGIPIYQSQMTAWKSVGAAVASSEV